MVSEKIKRRGERRKEKAKRETGKIGNGAASEKFGNQVTSNSVAGADNQSGTLFDNPIWLSTKDAAVYLRKFRRIDGMPSEGAVRNAIWRGQLKARKWQRRLYIKRTDLDQLLRNLPFLNGGCA
jgi:hypothetical protein